MYFFTLIRKSNKSLERFDTIHNHVLGMFYQVAQACFDTV